MSYRKVLVGLFLVGISWTMGYVAHAYNAEVVNNLRRTRDALLDQRSHLEANASSIQQKINDLSRQLNIVNGYLRDTDNALKDVDDAIRNAS
ncbi:MAG: hypothetical protein K2Z81_10560 [Cyanobacteria bacterium]|nr:hypothetical protein [Cyanobacteriota bacterium]